MRTTNPDILAANPVNPAPFRKAGSFVFLTGTGGYDTHTRRIVRGLDDLPKDVRLQLSSGNIHKDGVEGPILAQSWVMYQNLKELLARAGSSVEHMLHTIVFLRDIRQNWVAFDRIRQMMVKDPPPSMAIEMPRLGVSNEMLVQMHVIAATVGSGATISTERLTPDGELNRRRLYGAGIKSMGPLVFAMGTGGVEPGTRRTIRGLDDLPQDVRKKLSSGDFRTDGIQGRVMAQTWVGYQNVKRYLESGGSSLDNLVDEIVVLRDMKTSWPAFEKVRRIVLKDPPPITVAETPRLGISDDLMVEIHDIGGIPAISQPETPSQGVKRIGQFVFAVTTGGFDTATGNSIRGFDDIPNDVLGNLQSGSLLNDDLHEPMLAQSWTALQAMQTSLQSAGTSLDKTQQALVFMKNTRENWPAFDRVFRLLVRDPPPLTLVETAFVGSSEDCLLELHFTAIAHGSSKASTEKKP